MPFYIHDGVRMHIKFSGKLNKNPPAPCCAQVVRESIDPLRNETRKIRCRCMAISSIQCDWKLEDGKTCDAPLCAEHAHAIGPDMHLCAQHLEAKLKIEPELFP